MANPFAKWAITPPTEQNPFAPPPAAPPEQQPQAGAPAPVIDDNNVFRDMAPPQQAPQMRTWWTEVRGKRIQFEAPEGSSKAQVRALAKKAGVPDPENRSIQFGKPPEGPTASQQENNYGPIGTSIHQGVDFVAPFVDELAAGSTAFGQLMLGDTNFSDNYMNNLRYLEDRAANSEQMYPGEALGGKIGAFVSTLPAAAELQFLKGKNLLTTSLKSGAFTAPLAAANTYLSNPVDDRWNGVPESAAIGLGLGLGTPLAGKTIEVLGRRIDQRLGISDFMRRMANRFSRNPRSAEELANQAASEVMAARVPQKPSDMRERFDAFKEAGHEPTLVNVVDETGRGFIGSMARRPGPGRETAQRAYDARRLSAPERIDRNMAEVIAGTTDDPALQAQLKRPVDEVLTDLTEKRSSDIEAAMAPIRNEPVPLTPRMVEILDTADGRRAIARAMRTVTDRDTLEAMKALPGLLKQVGQLDPRLPPAARQQVMDQLLQGKGLTVDIADRLARKFNAMADSADADAQRALRSFAREIRDETRQASPAYSKAMEQYAGTSKRMAAIDTGEQFLAPKTSDEFVQRARGLSDENPTTTKAQPTMEGGSFRTENKGDGMHSFEYTTPDGRTIKGRVSFDPNNPKDAAIDIDPKEGSGLSFDQWAGANNFGPQLVRDLGRHVANAFPEVETVGGYRVSGARRAAGVDMDAEVNLNRFRDTTTEPSERQLAMQGARRATQRATGENISAAPGVARKIAVSPEQSARNNALFGPVNADKLERMMAITEKDLRDYAQIAPGTNSQTAIRGVDDEMAKGALEAMAHIKSGNPLQGALALLRAAGVREQDASRIVEMATDPAQTEQLIELLEKSYGRDTGAKIGRMLGLPAAVTEAQVIGGSR